MSIVVARKKRSALFLSICGLMLMAAAVTAVSARDPDGLLLRVGEIMITAGLAMWLPWHVLLAVTLAVWLGPNAVRANIDNLELMRSDVLLELPGLLGVAVFAALTRRSLSELEDEDVLIGTTNDDLVGVDKDTGVYEERLLRPALEAELARSRRFGRECALVLADLDERRERFDYRDDDDWSRSLVATAGLFRGTRNHIDRVYRYGPSGFALLLPESGAREVTGMVRRLRRVARGVQPPEGQPGGPLPTHFGATFFPQCATTTDDMLRRAEVALKLAEKSATRLQLDGAAAPEMPPPEQLRQADEPVEAEVELANAVGFDAARMIAPAAAYDARPHLALLETNSVELAAPAHLPQGAEARPSESLFVALSRLGPAPVSKGVEDADDSTHVNASWEAEPEPAALESEDDAVDDISAMLRRMDETLAMIRTLRSNATGRRQ